MTRPAPKPARRPQRRRRTGRPDAQERTVVAYCYRTGHIGIRKKAPRGAIPILRGTEAPVRQAICGGCRRNAGLFVPGVAGAADAAEAEAALQHFIARSRASFDAIVAEHTGGMFATQEPMP